MRLLQLFAVMLMVSVSLGSSVKPPGDEGDLRMRDGQSAERRGYANGPLQVAVVCFLQGEVISGFNKICYYDCLGSQAAITIASVQLCPLNIQR